MGTGVFGEGRKVRGEREAGNVYLFMSNKELYRNLTFPPVEDPGNVRYRIFAKTALRTR